MLFYINILIQNNLNRSLQQKYLVLSKRVKKMDNNNIFKIMKHCCAFFKWNFSLGKNFNVDLKSWVKNRLIKLSSSFFLQLRSEMQKKGLAYRVPPIEVLFQF
eukprot:TRINITY_DN38494_c0_g1_i1.p5 TRINITY_DN38494_c0_g1~~TRINITY_DN38494_c0_g1_i1.p5  ORF type:complete len:103 (+),score=4.08 TRINITY_DN38494_c0_g1_i1:396-704(+)